PGETSTHQQVGEETLELERRPTGSTPPPLPRFSLGRPAAPPRRAAPQRSCPPATSTAPAVVVLHPPSSTQSRSSSSLGRRRRRQRQRGIPPPTATKVIPILLSPLVCSLLLRVDAFLPSPCAVLLLQIHRQPLTLLSCCICSDFGSCRSVEVGVSRLDQTLQPGPGHLNLLCR
uniref:Uncharacterized protein n=1 Tax=Triticum urartu TaxID=4572 RepID=A0A8R7PWA6_TRIUA